MKKPYYTKQMTILVNFFKKNSDKQFTILEISNIICNSDLGKSTVYRLVSKLLGKGEIKRYVKDGSKQFVYQYNTLNTCKSHLHLKCTDCGKVIHLENDISSAFENRVLKSNDFIISEELSMLYGKCNNCNKN